MKKLFILVALFWGSWSFASFASIGQNYVYEGLKAQQSHNYIKAAELFKKACDRGNSKGCANLGILYEYGQGVRQNSRKAKEYYTKALIHRYN